MAYSVLFRKPIPQDNLLKFKGTTNYFEIAWAGFASDDVIKVEATTDNAAYVSQYSFITGAADGIKDAVIGPLNPATRVLRIKGYDSDGTTPLTAATEAYKVSWAGNVKKTKVDGLRDLSLDIDSIADQIQDSGVKGIKRSNGDVYMKTVYSEAMDGAYDAIEAADGTQTDIIRVALKDITWNNTNRGSYGTEKYPKAIRKGIEAFGSYSKWVMNGTAMSVPHWISKNYIYSFLSVAKAQACEDILALKASRKLLTKKRTEYGAGSQEYAKLTAGITKIDAIVTEKIAEI